MIKEFGGLEKPQGPTLRSTWYTVPLKKLPWRLMWYYLPASQRIWISVLGSKDDFMNHTLTTLILQRKKGSGSELSLYIYILYLYLYIYTLYVHITKIRIIYIHATYNVYTCSSSIHDIYIHTLCMFYIYIAYIFANLSPARLRTSLRGSLWAMWWSPVRRSFSSLVFLPPPFPGEDPPFPGEDPPFPGEDILSYPRIYKDDSIGSVLKSINLSNVIM